MKVKITADQIGLVQGNLYEISTEDGIAHVFDTEIAAFLGKDVWVLRNFVVKGYGVDEEVGCFPNRNYRNQAQVIVDRILARGVIDTTHWVKVSTPSLEEREAYNLRREREEAAGW
jgi:hypothetical protein